MSPSLKKGDSVRIAQDAAVSEYSKEDKTLYYKQRLPKSVIGIYLRKFSEFNDHLHEVIIGDKILYIVEQDLREIKDEQTGKICVYHGTSSAF